MSAITLRSSLILFSVNAPSADVPAACRSGDPLVIARGAPRVLTKGEFTGLYPSLERLLDTVSSSGGDIGLEAPRPNLLFCREAPRTGGRPGMFPSEMYK